jgi:hypothetical protein
VAAIDNAEGGLCQELPHTTTRAESPHGRQEVLDSKALMTSHRPRLANFFLVISLPFCSCYAATPLRSEPPLGPFRFSRTVRTTLMQRMPIDQLTVPSSSRGVLALDLPQRWLLDLCPVYGDRVGADFSFSLLFAREFPSGSLGCLQALSKGRKLL